MRRAWTSRIASQVGRKRTGAASRPRAAAPGEVEEPGAVERTGSSRSSAARAVRTGTPAQSARSRAPPGRSPRGSGARAGRARRPPSRRGGRPTPRRARSVRPPPLPGARRRHAHELEPRADAARGGASAEAAVLGQLGVRARRAGEERARLRDAASRSSAPRRPGRRGATTPPARGGSRARTARSPRARRGGSSRGAASPGSARAARARGQVVALEALEARPEPQVAVRRVLVLDPGELFDRARQRQPRPLEQELPREQRSVQLALRQHPLGPHRASLPGTLDRCPPARRSRPRTAATHAGSSARSRRSGFPRRRPKGRFALLELVLPRGASPPLHTHPQDESYVVLDGSLTLVAGGERSTLGPGGAATVPMGVPHTFRAESDEVRALLVSTPAGIERMILDGLGSRGRADAAAAGCAAPFAGRARGDLRAARDGAARARRSARTTSRRRARAASSRCASSGPSRPRCRASSRSGARRASTGRRRSGATHRSRGRPRRPARARRQPPRARASSRRRAAGRGT